MNKLFNYLPTLLIKLLALNFVFVSVYAEEQASQIVPNGQLQQAQTKPSDISISKDPSSQDALLKHLAIEQGKGTFLQRKYFKFLTQPIRSQGSFIVNQQSLLWQTETPVFSQLLVSPNAIFKRQSPDESYISLVENSALSAVLATLFKGQFKAQHWSLLNSDKISSFTEDSKHQKNINCLNLQPKSQQLTLLFKSAKICLHESNVRQIDLTDSQDNKTEILMTLSSKTLDMLDLDKLKFK